MVETEINGERGETYKVFDIGNKQKRFEIHCKPIHYKTEGTNTFNEIDVSIKTLADRIGVDANLFTLGFRQDTLSEKCVGIRYRGKSEYQFEITPIGIKLGQTTVGIPESFKAVQIKNDYDIEQIVTDDISLVHHAHEAYLRTAIKTAVPDDFEIVFRINTVGLKCINPSKGSEFVQNENGEFVFDSPEKPIRIVQPTMWVDEGNVSHEINHTLTVTDGVYTYTKTPTEAGKEWLNEQIGIVYIDATTYYAETSDGYTRTRSSNWTTSRTTSTVYAKDNTAIASNDAITCEKISAYYYIWRTWLWFDTSGIGADYQVDDCAFHGYNAAFDATDVCALKSVQNDTHASWTANAHTGDEYGHVTWAADIYNVITFNAQGKSDVEMEGTTKVCLREYTHDYLNSAPSVGYRNSMMYADYTGTDYDPKLVITSSAVGGTDYFDTVSGSLSLSESLSLSQIDFNVVESDAIVLVESETDANTFNASEAGSISLAGALQAELGVTMLAGITASGAETHGMAFSPTMSAGITLTGTEVPAQLPTSRSRKGRVKTRVYSWKDVFTNTGNTNRGKQGGKQ